MGRQVPEQLCRDICIVISATSVRSRIQSIWECPEQPLLLGSTRRPPWPLRLARRRPSPTARPLPHDVSRPTGRPPCSRARLPPKPPSPELSCVWPLRQRPGRRRATRNLPDLPSQQLALKQATNSPHPTFPRIPTYLIPPTHTHHQPTMPSSRIEATAFDNIPDVIEAFRESFAPRPSAPRPSRYTPPPQLCLHFVHHPSLPPPSGASIRPSPLPYPASIAPPTPQHHSARSTTFTTTPARNTTHTRC